MRGASELVTDPHPDEALRARPTSPVLRSGEVADGEYVTRNSVSSVCSCSKQTAQQDRAIVALVGDRELVARARLGLRIQ